jgi:serine/threonine protein kinase
MFLDEVRIAAALQHPNIVRVVDFGVGEGGHYLAMEYLHGRTGQALLRQCDQLGPLPLEFSLSVVEAVARGLDYAHHYRSSDGRLVEVVHRDVSPTNVMVTFNGEVKLLDFGIARVTEQTQHTKAGTLKGKVGYMSPEQCSGEPIDRRSDVFGLGILLYELTVGRRAFYGENDFAVMHRIFEGHYVKPTARQPGYPQVLEDIIDKALSTKPHDRHDSAGDFAAELQAAAFSLGLDLSPERRQAVLAERFGSPHWPVVDPSVFDIADDIEVPGRSRARWVGLTLGIGAALGAVGFLAGGGLEDRSPQTVQEPVPVVSPVLIESADTQSGEPEVEHVVEFIEAEPAAGGDTPTTSTRKSKRRKRRGSRRRQPKPTSKPRDDAAVDAIVPPSMRK